MPQASDDLRDRMGLRFGDRIDLSGPQQYLKDHGWKENPGYTWSKEGFTRRNMDDIPEDEWECMRFLIEEWDWGSVR